MPKLKWTGCEDIDVAAKLVGPRVRHIRENRGLSQRDLAERSKISKTTLIRLEHGFPIAEKQLERVCNALQTILPNLMVSADDWDAPYRVHRGSESNWRMAFRRSKAPSSYQDFMMVESPSERKRIGNLGFVSGFLQSLECTLREGKLEAAVLELYGNQEREGYRHSGEEFVYCLSGHLRVTIAKTVVELKAGDCVTFKSRYRHRYESLLPAGFEGEPTKMLMVWLEDKEELEAITADEECEPHD
jgi:transcriptional regulator with XRE-family HTH domain/mannose-6-phosphate isomerase-like protein (cupin superfamily)